MREILFRGKRKDNGEWVEGNGIIQGQDGISYARWVDICDDKVRYEVIPETIGQLTGLTDKNGKKIFEGDCIGCRENAIEYVDGTFTINGDRPLSWLKGTEDFVVIGNIYDNPELLGE